MLLEEEGESVEVCGFHNVPRHCEFWALRFIWFAGHAVHLLVVEVEALNSNRWLRLRHLQPWTSHDSTTG